MLEQSYISLFLNNPNIWGKSLQFWKKQVDKKKITQGEREKIRRLGNDGGNLSPVRSQRILCLYLLLLFPFNTHDFPVFIPYLFASLAFSPCDWISYMTHWQPATASSQKRAHFSGKAASFPLKGRGWGRGSWECDDGKFKGRTKVWKLKEIICSQKQTMPTVPNSHLTYIFFMHVCISRCVEYLC